MAATLDKDDPRRVMLLAAYNFCARHKRDVTTEDDWADAVADMEKTCHEHDNHPFLIDLLTACYADMEREAMRTDE